MLAASTALPLAFGARSAAAANSDKLELARNLIFAFFTASNLNNWQFVSDALAADATGRSNHSHWLYWAKTLAAKDKNVQQTLEMGFHGHLGSGDEIYQFLRTRQYKQGWMWVLPNEKDSIWSPSLGVYCSFSRWERTDGGSYHTGTIDTRPTLFHSFQIDDIAAFGATVSTKISWMQEVDVGGIIYG